jgi:hypothetical protein
MTELASSARAAIRAPRGSRLTARSWLTEAPLRMRARTRAAEWNESCPAIYSSGIPRASIEASRRVAAADMPASRPAT